ncbi:MAG: VOC family protein [Pseudomonadota bacterium]
MLQGIHHVSINVRDVDEALRFYRDGLGMTELARPDLGFAGAWLKSGDQEVHLLGIEGPAAPKEQHFAFLVPDLAPVLAHLADLAIDCSEPQAIPGVCRQAFCRDPSGNLVEFNERIA